MTDETAEAAPNPMMEQLAGVAAVLPAIIDRYFDTQKEKMELERMKMAAMYQQQGRPNHGEGY